MNSVSASTLVDAFLVLLPGAAQAAIAWQQGGTLRSAFPDRPIARRLPHPGLLMALSYGLAAVAHQLVPPAAGEPPSAGRIVTYVSIDVLVILGLAGYVHLARKEAHPEAPPPRRWLAVHYGIAAALCLLAATFPAVIPLPTIAQQLRVYQAAFLAYYLTTAGRIVGFLVGPSGVRSGVALFACGMVLAAGGGILLEIARAPALVAPLVAAIGLAFAVPFATGRLQSAVRAMLGVVAAVVAWRVANAGVDALDALAAAGGRLAGPPPLAIAAASVSAVLGLVWGICARRAFRARQRPGGDGPLAGVLAVLMTCMTAFSVLTAICWLVASPELPATPWVAALYFLHDWTLLAAAALAMHAVRLVPGDTHPPTPRWVALSYVVAGAIGFAGVILLSAVSSGSLEQRVRVYVAVQNLYVMGAVAFVVSRLVPLVPRSRPWRPSQDLLRGGPSWSDVLVFGLVVAGVGGWTLSLAREPPGWAPTPLKLVLTAVTGTASLFPVALRSLGEVVRVVLGILVALAVATVTYVGIQVAVTPLAGVGLDRLAVPLAAAVLALGFVPLQAWLRGALERTIFRRSQRRREQLQDFLHELSPELGALECSRRAAGVLVEVLRCRGAAILLDGGESVGSGGLAAGTLERGWPRGSRADPRIARPLLGYELAALPAPLRETLGEMPGSMVVLPLRSPRRYWGHIVVTAGLLASAFGDEDLQVAEAFADQLALILDTTELLERAVSVERSLAHAEKLAAVGETAARIAHDIRNPVTAARSLAQQLARAPLGADGEAARVIVEELDRIEHHVSALLRFARREEFRFEAVDLGLLVRGALEPFLPRLRAAEVDVELDAPGGIVARADAERMRQVLANLIENALAALAGASRPRRLVVAVTGDDGVARVRVADSGPGVPAEALPRLFEPFFSLKPTGTGLGLAIAKRTIDAHGGRITAEAPSGAGLRIDLEVPLTRSP